MKLSYTVYFGGSFPGCMAALAQPGEVWDVEFVPQSEENDQNFTHYINCGSLTEEKCRSIVEEAHALYLQPFSLESKLPQNKIDRSNDYLDIVRFITLKMISAIIGESGFDSSSSPFANKQKIRLILFRDEPMEKKINDICHLANEALEKRESKEGVYAFFGEDHSSELYQEILQVADSSRLYPLYTVARGVNRGCK